MSEFILPSGTPPDKPNGGTPFDWSNIPDEALPDALNRCARQGSPLPPLETIGRANRENARRYIRRGWVPLPVPLREKGPRKNDWSKRTVEEAERALWADFGQAVNIGVVLGEPSGGLVDIDLDDLAAVRTARHFWPWELVFGHHSKTESHILLIATDSIPNRKPFTRVTNGSMLLEVRGTGAQTIFPHSIHPLGELIIWYKQGEPPRMPGQEILRRALLHWTTLQLLEFYPAPGNRHNFALDVAGFLLRTLGLPLEDAKRVILAMAEAAADDETRDRLQAVLDTAKKHSARLPVTGAPTLAKRIPDAVIADLRKCWGVNEPAIEIRSPSRRGEIPTLPTEEAVKIVTHLSKTIEEITREDLPEDALEGRLGEIYQRQLAFFPRAYGWLALVTLASVKVPYEEGDPIRPQLYTALVGAPGTGKSNCIERAAQILEIRNYALRVKSGSIEGLAKNNKLAAKGEPRVLIVSELAHILKKCSIDNSTFANVLCDLYYANQDTLIIKEGKECPVDIRLSLIGGIPEEAFAGAFGPDTVYGLYSRFAIGLCPAPFELQLSHLYRKPQPAKISPRPVEVDPEVGEALDEWKRREGIHPRDCEIAARVALVCASVDGHTRLTAQHLAPHLAFARYLRDVRQLLEPTQGRDKEVRCGERIKRALERHRERSKAAGGSEWLPVRKLRHRISVDRDFGAPTWRRVLFALHRDGEIEIADIEGVLMVRLAAPIDDEIAEKRAKLQAKVTGRQTATPPAGEPGETPQPESETPPNPEEADEWDPEEERRLLASLDE